MKKILFSFLSLAALVASGQSNVYPAAKQSQPIAITGATIHIGNGQVVNNATVVMVDGKITAVGNNITIPTGAQRIDAQGKHVYPGLILSASNLGLVEISSVRASSDVREIGDLITTGKGYTTYPVIRAINDHELIVAY